MAKTPTGSNCLLLFAVAIHFSTLVSLWSFCLVVLPFIFTGSQYVTLNFLCRAGWQAGFDDTTHLLLSFERWEYKCMILCTDLCSNIISVCCMYFDPIKWLLKVAIQSIKRFFKKIRNIICVAFWSEINNWSKVFY